MTKTAAIIGGGVIGGGWAARFLLNGWDVNVFDLDINAERKITAVLENARKALPQLYDVAMPQEGKIQYFDNMNKAVENAAWIQESVPERLEIKHQVYRELIAFAPDDAVIGSSTSGFRPSQLCEQCDAPHQVIVAHPYNPVYLLPIVEVVATPQTNEQLVSKAKKILTEIGMKPLHLKREIDAHIGDRLLEAVWREALWMIKDGIATTKDIDDCITHGFGLRWAQMGLFETYRVAGGEAGMKHFIGQFGPALQWPWTKLTDVPELTNELVNKIADQSDSQSGKNSIAQLEKMRDQNLVGFLKVLRNNNWSAGKHLNNVNDDNLADTLKPTN